MDYLENSFVKKQKVGRPSAEILRSERCRSMQRRINVKDAYVNLVDLVESFQTSFYLQKLASIQPRTGLSKFAENY